MAVAGLLFWLFLPEKYTVNMPFQFANSLSAEETLERLVIADGFSMTGYADKLSGARALAITETGDLIVSRPNLGQLTLVFADKNADGLSDGNKLLLKGLNRPHGIALHHGWLYIAETDAVLRIRYDAAARKFLGTPRYIIRDSFPGGGNHWSRTVKVGPDNKLYVSIGSSCNVCHENTPKRACILQYNLDGTNEVLFASGLRNTVGIDWDSSRKLYGVDNGRDLLGDDTPPEELNQINLGEHYGWPYEYGRQIADNDFANTKPSQLKTSAPSHEMTAHSAPLSVLFPKHNTLLLNNTALVSLHGSWNRSEKSGYKIVALTITPDKEIKQRDFITGFEHGGTVIGRPVDLVEDKLGNIYLSDDYSGRIYKISATKSP
ncbi:MAG: hypothetical protein A6F71_00525 [Cycloclasticus sp. symbiont of Poecilosclerida sp. M]|nr:MAG: hypothetical protein A6F71_00525 [Cycloclasticus sp. symbiont of Poecilosclerida sp. M]